MTLINPDSWSGYATSSRPCNNSCIPSYTLEEIQQKYNTKFNTLVADCEGFLGQFFDENPDFYDQLELILFEKDEVCWCDYNKIITNLQAHGFVNLVSGFHDVWEKKKLSYRFTLRQWQGLAKDVSGMIVQASSMNKDDGWQPFPIGMSWQFVKVHHLGTTALQVGTHENLLLCGFNRDTDRYRRDNGFNRTNAEHYLRQNGFENQTIPFTDYFLTLPTYKFVASPEGNGIDCHRHYEALMAGCIPIMELNPLTEEKYKGCPVLWTTDFSEVNEEYLLQKYKEMLDTQYDFSCLFLSSYPVETQTVIKDSGNFWLSEIPETRCTWY
jgi:hypothetical protein